jgi:hypothetical protein
MARPFACVLLQVCNVSFTKFVHVLFVAREWMIPHMVPYCLDYSKERQLDTAT